jgi:hypothetical protein
MALERFIPINPEIPSIDMDELRHWGKVHSYMTTDYAIKGTRCSSANAANSECPRKAWIWPCTSISPKEKWSLRNVDRNMFQNWLCEITKFGRVKQL